MLLSLILGLVIGAVSVIFALQNIFPVTVTFLVWNITASLALLIVLAMFVGIIISSLLSIPGAISNALTISRLKKENKKLADEVEMARQKENNIVASTTVERTTVEQVGVKNNI